MESNGITELLRALHEGKEEALEPMVRHLYRELRVLARRQLRGNAPTLHPTSLVHEAYLRLIGKSEVGWANRRHFYSAAARAMRDVVVERARRAAALKRGGGRAAISLDDAEIALSEKATELLALDVALEELRGADENAAEVVMLRYFSGLSGDETAAALGVSPSTVDRRWSYAKAWLHRRLDGRAK